MTASSIEPTRIALFGSLLRGKAIVDQVLALQKEFPRRVRLCGVATDDPFKPFVNPANRVWRHLTRSEIDASCAALTSVCDQAGVELYKGSIRGLEFRSVFDTWRQSIVYMERFGQHVPVGLIKSAGVEYFLNCHPTTDRSPWRSRYLGPWPFEEMLATASRMA